MTRPACGADDHELLAMVYISSWQEFQEAAEGLYEKSPNKVRTLTLLLDDHTQEYQ